MRNNIKTLMFIEIENYTELIQRLGDTDTERSAAWVEQFQVPYHQAINQVIERYQDAELEVTDNRFIARFLNPADAVQSAVEIQKDLVEINLITPLADEPPLRVGIGVDTDTEPDTSEVESVARGGEILISEKVYDRLKEAYDSSNRDVLNLSHLVFHWRDDLLLVDSEKENLIEVLWGISEKTLPATMELLEDSDRNSERESIVVIDTVGSTEIADDSGWDIVRKILRVLKTQIVAIGQKYGLQCRKSTGDGYLLTYADLTKQSYKNAAVNAVEASFHLLDQLKKHNSDIPEEEQVHVRIAIHFGEVDIVEGDREGPKVTFAFRLEGIDREAVANTRYRRIEPDQFPEQDYVICSEVVSKIIAERCPTFRTYDVGLFKLKGVSGQHPVYLVERAENSQQ